MDELELIENYQASYANARLLAKHLALPFYEGDIIPSEVVHAIAGVGVCCEIKGYRNTLAVNLMIAGDSILLTREDAIAAIAALQEALKKFDEAA